MIIIFTSFLIIAIIGYIAQRIGICLIRGIGQAIDGDPALLLAILLSGCWLWIYFFVSNYFGWANNLPRYAYHPIFLIGGFIFGIGAGINQACSVSTMNHLTRGNLSMMMTMVGWAIGWTLWMGLSLQSDWDNEFYQTSEHFSNQTIVLFFLPALAITLQRLIYKPEQRDLWFGILVFGLLATSLFLLQPNWPPSRLIQDMGGAIFSPDVVDWPELQRYIMLMALSAGMWLAAIRNHEFRFRMFTIKSILRHLPAGILMGIGGAMALGGNDSHLLLGLPTLSYASLAAVIGMLTGILVERWVYKKFIFTGNNRAV